MQNICKMDFLQNLWREKKKNAQEICRKNGGYLLNRSLCKDLLLRYDVFPAASC